MDADELFDHALNSLPEAVGDLLRDDLDTDQFVFASFDGASQLGMALIATDRSGDAEVTREDSRAAVERMILDARRNGEELVVSFMITKEILTRLLSASSVNQSTRIAVALWLEKPLHVGHFRVIAIAGEHVRAATVDAGPDLELDEAPVSSSMLN
jgi:hypothetical protein